MHITCECGYHVEVWEGSVSCCPQCGTENEPPRDTIPIHPDQPQHYIHLEMMGPFAFRDLSFLPGMDAPPEPEPRSKRNRKPPPPGA